MDILSQAQLDSTLRRQSPFAQYQIVEVTFGTSAAIDTEVNHSLQAPTPDHVAWLVIRQSQPGTIYRAATTAWGSNYIKLRSTVPGLVATLLLFVAQDQTDAADAPLDTPPGDPWLACGATSLTAGNGFWLAYNNGTPQMRIGDPAGGYVSWDGSSLTVKGAITATSGSITGALTIGTSGSISSGATSFAAGDGIWLAYNGGTPQFRVGLAAGDRISWDGSALTVYGDIFGDDWELTNTNGLLFDGDGTSEGVDQCVRWGDYGYMGGNSNRTWIFGPSTTHINLYSDTIEFFHNSTAYLGIRAGEVELYNAALVPGDSSGAAHTLGASSAPFYNFYFDPPSTDYGDYPVVWSSGNHQLYYKSDGWTGTITYVTDIDFGSGTYNTDSISFENGICVG